MSAKKKKASAKVAKKRAKPAKGASGSAKVKKAAGAVAKKKAAKKPVAKKGVVKKLSAKSAPKKAAKKPIAKKAPAKRAAKKVAPVSKLNGKAAVVKRRDATGHLDPAYEAALRARIEEERSTDDNTAFGVDALSSELGEEFVETVTSGEDEGTEIRDQSVTEELGGPFTVTSSNTEFAGDVDESNPEGATREPFPRT